MEQTSAKEIPLKIKNNYILLSKSLFKSEVWCNKPVWWLKVWIYLLLSVNHKDNQKGNIKLKRSQGHFKRERIYDRCSLSLEGVKAKSVDNALRWLRKTRQIKTHKTTRGVIITICNYERYQNVSSLKNDTGKETIKEGKNG